MSQFTPAELEMIIDSLKYKKKAYEDYPIGDGYPSYEFKLTQIRVVEALISKVQDARRDLKWITHWQIEGEENDIETFKFCS